MISYWEVKLRGKAALLPTLKHLSQSFTLLLLHIQYCGLQDLIHMKSSKQLYSLECLVGDIELLCLQDW